MADLCGLFPADKTNTQIQEVHKYKKYTNTRSTQIQELHKYKNYTNTKNTQNMNIN